MNISAKPTTVTFSNRLLKNASGFIIGLTFIVSFLVIYFLPIPEFSIEDKKYSVGYEEVYINIEKRPQPSSFVEISNLSDTDLKKIVYDMSQTMLDADGIGLAAPQVHLSHRMFIYINPEIDKDDQDDKDNIDDKDNKVNKDEGDDTNGIDDNDGNDDEDDDDGCR